MVDSLNENLKWGSLLGDFLWCDLFSFTGEQNDLKSSPLVGVHLEKEEVLVND